MTDDLPAAQTSDEARKAELEKARLDNRAAKQKVDEYDSPAAQAQRQAEAAQKTAEANKAAASARTAQIAAYSPDLSQVKDSTLDVSKAPALWSVALGQAALGRVSREVVKRLTHEPSNTPAGGKPSQASEWRVLVTSDEDLATADSVYEDVSRGFVEMIEAAEQVRDMVTPRTVVRPYRSVGILPFVPFAVAAAPAIVSAVPGLLSLLAAHRTVSSNPISVSDVFAALAVAGSLAEQEHLTVMHDDFRLLPKTFVTQQLHTLGERRRDLLQLKLQLAVAQDLARQRSETLQAEMERIQGDLKDATSDEAQLRNQLRESKKAKSHTDRQVADATAGSSLLTDFLTSVDQFIASVTATPVGGKRSLIAAAALREVLHPGACSPTSQHSFRPCIRGGDLEDLNMLILGASPSELGAGTTQAGTGTPDVRVDSRPSRSVTEADGTGVDATDTDVTNENCVDTDDKHHEAGPTVADDDLTKPFTHVLLVKAGAGSSDQVVSKRLFRSDSFSTVGQVSLTYALLDVGTSAILRAGTLVGTATAHGSIGKAFDVTVDNTVYGLPVPSVV